MIDLLKACTRKIAIGDSFAFVGPTFVLAVLNVGTDGSLAVCNWIDAQDDCALLADTILPDGRMVFVLERLFTKQTREAAEVEFTKYRLGTL